MRDPGDEEIRKLWDNTGVVPNRERRTNIYVFILDSQARFVHGFGGFPDGAINPSGHSSSQAAKYFRGEIEKGLRKLTVPDVQAPPSLRLPDVESGARVFVRTRGIGDRRGAPIVVEAVSMKSEEWDVLAHPSAQASVDAKKLSPWLRQIYPPGFNEHLYPWERIEGTLSLAPAGEKEGIRWAILRGEADLSTSEGSGRSMKVSVEAVLRYSTGEGKRPSMRAVVEGKYPRDDEFRGEILLPVQSAVESRPR